jgi:hypothetical protein
MKDFLGREAHSGPGATSGGPSWANTEKRMLWSSNSSGGMFRVPKAACAAGMPVPRCSTA